MRWLSKSILAFSHYPLLMWKNPIKEVVSHHLGHEIRVFDSSSALALKKYFGFFSLSTIDMEKPN
jgi:hypothetical protein